MSSSAETYCSQTSACASSSSTTSVRHEQRRSGPAPARRSRRSAPRPSRRAGRRRTRRPPSPPRCARRTGPSASTIVPKCCSTSSGCCCTARLSGMTMTPSARRLRRHRRSAWSTCSRRVAPSGASTTARPGTSRCAPMRSGLSNASRSSFFSDVNSQPGLPRNDGSARLSCKPTARSRRAVSQAGSIRVRLAN